MKPHTYCGNYKIPLVMFFSSSSNSSPLNGKSPDNLNKF